MKMMLLRRDKSSEPIAFLTKMDHAKLIATRLGIEKYETVPVEVSFKEMDPFSPSSEPDKSS